MSMRKMVLAPFAALALAAAALAVAGCGGGSKFDFTVAPGGVVNYSNPMTTIFPGGQAIITLDANGAEFPTTPGSYIVYFTDSVEGPYDGNSGGAPSIATMFTDNQDGTFQIVVTIPTTACVGAMYVTAEDYQAPPYQVPLPNC